MNSKSARVLVALVVPGHLLFLYTVQLLQGGHTAMTPTFIICYLCAALLQVRNTLLQEVIIKTAQCLHLKPSVVLLQVVVLLYSSVLMIRWLWRRSLDPDNYSIPYLTALGDLLGTAFLALTFRFLMTGSSEETGLLVSTST